MTPASGHYPIETMRDRLRDHSRRLMRLERAPVYPYTLPTIPVVAVASFSASLDTDAAIYDITANTYHYQGATHTPDEWQAMHP